MGILTKILRPVFRNAARPSGPVGRVFLAMMNRGHTPLSKWGLARLETGPDFHVLDIGCGGGKNIARLLERIPLGKVFGLDISPTSVKASVSLNRKAVLDGRADIRQGGSDGIPWPDGSFDAVTAFETVYFWPDWPASFAEVRRVLKQGGTFLICNSSTRTLSQGPSAGFWTEVVDLKDPPSEEICEALDEAGFGNIFTEAREGGGMVLRGVAAG
ncbi:MAG: class I SAM-dependent methyltransferase [Deltaproteobacteria bacterium]|jgi:SAM-dependent methyltransferase|nr:class I SAM-dependent methyltransferase [Deltaproteobacteria bacterium]